MGMNRILLVLAFFCVCCLTACTKSALYGSVQYKAQAKIDDQLVQQFLTANNLQGIAKHVQLNDTIGVYYIVLNPGGDTTLYTNATQVTVGDTAKWISSATTEKVFYETNDFHPSYPLGSVIRAWQLGIPEINVGGEVRLIVPSRYAYGHFPQEQIGLPANAVLDFYIRLYDVTN